MPRRSERSEAARRHRRKGENGATAPTLRMLAYPVSTLVACAPYGKTLVYAALKRGEIKSVRLGARIGIPASEFLRLFGELPA